MIRTSFAFQTDNILHGTVFGQETLVRIGFMNPMPSPKPPSFSPPLELDSTSPYGPSSANKRTVKMVATSWLSKYWVIWLVLAFIVFETTSQPALAAMLACVKVGWDDFTLARWLFRIDPNRRGALVRSSVFVAWGFAKIALTGTLVMVATIVVMDLLRWAGQPWLQLIRALWGALVALLIGLTFSGLVALYATLWAWILGQKLFVGKAVTLAREGNYWPPIEIEARWSLFDRGGNRVSWLFALTWLWTLGFGGVFIQTYFARQIPNRMEARQKAAPWILAFAGFTILGYFYLGRKTIATSPEECWALPDWVNSQHFLGVDQDQEGDTSWEVNNFPEGNPMVSKTRAYPPSLS